MRKLALNDEILLKIEKPARYIGGEYNSVMKDPEKVSLSTAKQRGFTAVRMCGVSVSILRG